MTSFLKYGVCTVGPLSALVASRRGWGQLQLSCLHAPCKILLLPDAAQHVPRQRLAKGFRLLHALLCTAWAVLHVFCECCCAAPCRVGVGWIRDSCRRCRFCMRGNENLCVKGYDGLIVGRECLLLHQPNVASSTKYSLDAELQSLSCCGQTCDCCSC